MQKTPNLTRLAFAILFVLGALTNITMLITIPEAYQDFAIDTFLPVYQEIWDSVVYPNLWLFVGAVAVFEVVLAVLLLSKEYKVWLGLWFSIGYMIILIPFWWFGGALINVVFLIILIWLTRFTYPLNMREFLKQTLGYPG